MGSTVDSHDSGERKVEVLSKVEAMKGESCKKLHQQYDWTVPTGSKTKEHKDGTAGECQRASIDMREQNRWWHFLFVPRM